MRTKADDFDYSSTTVPEAALFVAADEPVLVFPSAAAAERSLEAIDVKNGVYSAAYGPRGEKYTVRAMQDRVHVKPTGERERPEELRPLLLRYLEDSGREAEANATAEVLVAEVWKLESEFWQEHDPFGDRFGTSVPMWGCLAFLLVLGRRSTSRSAEILDSAFRSLRTLESVAAHVQRIGASMPDSEH